MMKKKQAKNIEDFIKMKVDIIILHAINPQTAGNIIKKAKEKNIPIIAMDRLPENIELDGYVTADSFLVGIEQTKYVADQIDHKGKIIILKGDKNNNVAREITEGIKEELKKEPKIEVISEEWHEKWSLELAEKTTRKALTKHPDIKAILANNSKMALAAVKVLKEKCLNDKIITIGADASKEACQSIVKGELNADIDKMPYALGLSSLKIATMIVKEEDWLYDQKVKNGEYKIPVKIIPVLLIDKYNIIRMEDHWGPLEK